MASAVWVEGLVRKGEATDQPELARLAQVTRPRMTWIGNQLRRAPDIQESLLFLPRVEPGRAPIHENLIRPTAAETRPGGSGARCERGCGGWGRTSLHADERLEFDDAPRI